MSFKKSPFVLLLIVFSLILAAYSQQAAQALAARPDLADSTAVHEEPSETDNPTVPLNSTDTYTGSAYLPIITGGRQTTAGGYTVVDTGLSIFARHGSTGFRPRWSTPMGDDGKLQTIETVEGTGRSGWI